MTWNLLYGWWVFYRYSSASFMFAGFLLPVIGTASMEVSHSRLDVPTLSQFHNPRMSEQCLSVSLWTTAWNPVIHYIRIFITIKLYGDVIKWISEKLEYNKEKEGFLVWRLLVKWNSVYGEILRTQKTLIFPIFHHRVSNYGLQS